jgi:ACS family tartrate transporter-like MFS transporter
MPFLFVLYIIAYIDRINIGFAGLQMTAELHFSDAVFGFGSGVFFVGYGLLGIPGAVLIEKWSARKAIAITMLVWGFVASATGLIHSAPEFYVMRFVLGVTEAGFFPGVIGYLSHWYRGQDRAKAIAMFMAAIPVSQVVAAPLSAALMKINWLGLAGWRWLLILEGAPAVIAAVASLVYLNDRPHDAKWLAADEREWLAAELAREQARRRLGKRMSLLDALGHRDVLLLALAYFGGSCGTYGLSLWMPKMIQRLGHMSVATSSLLSAIPALVGVPAMLLNGWHSDRTGERRWHAAIPRFIAAAALACLAVATVNVPVALVLLALGSAGIVAGYPAIWAIPSSFLGSAAAAASIGLINSFGNLGGFAGPYLIGVVSSYTGAFAGGMWFIAGGALISAVLVLLVRHRPNDGV